MDGDIWIDMFGGKGKEIDTFALVERVVGGGGGEGRFGVARERG